MSEPANPLTHVVQGESWLDLGKVVLAVWATVWVMAALHDQYLIRIAPEHFTVWHPHISETRSLTLLAIYWSFWATLSPGIFLGLLLYPAARVSDRPKRSIRQIVVSVAVGWGLVEICALTTGSIVWARGTGLYPDDFYPDNSLGLLITQTIQLTTYLAGFMLSLILVAWTWWVRGSSRRRTG